MQPFLFTTAALAVDATKIYGEGDTEVRALDGVDAHFEQGRFTAIMGPSGSGKSHSHALPRGARHAERWAGLHRRD